jgi:hypothetical protein
MLPIVLVFVLLTALDFKLPSILISMPPSALPKFAILQAPECDRLHAPGAPDYSLSSALDFILLLAHLLPVHGWGDYLRNG